MAHIENHIEDECQYAACDICDLSESALARYATDLLGQGSRDGLMIHDENIGLTHGIILSRSDASEDDVSDSNFRIMRDDLEAFRAVRDGYSAIAEDVYTGGWRGFGGGEWLIVRVYAPECSETDTGEHDGQWSEEGSDWQCVACGDDFNKGERVYTEAFAQAVHLSLYIQDHCILDEDDWSELSTERNLRALQESINACADVMEERYPDDSGADRRAVRELVAVADDAWDYPIMYSDEHWIDEDELLELWEAVRGNYLTGRAPVLNGPGQLTLDF